jgi:hypothetical protein
MTTRMPGFENIRPPEPTRRSENVAMRTAYRIVKQLNLDDFYWSPERIHDKVWEMKQALIEGVTLHRMIGHLCRKYNGWDIPPEDFDGVDEHCCHIGTAIHVEETNKAIAEWKRTYEVE